MNRFSSNTEAEKPKESTAKGNKAMLRIGILSQGGKDWIAGTIYLHNLIRSLQLLPDKLKPEIFLLYNCLEDLDFHEGLGTALPSVHRFHYLASKPIRHRLGTFRKNLLRGTIPTSLESLSKRMELDVLFPALDTLGDAFPVPWIAWIPDFQHNRLPDMFPLEERTRRNGLFAKQIDEANRIVVSSKDAYNDLVKLYEPEHPEKVSCLPYPSLPQWEWCDENPGEVARKYDLPEKFLMFPSQFWKHKNHRTLFESIRQARDSAAPDIVLVCTGMPQDAKAPEHASSLVKFIRANRLEENIRILGFLPREDQFQLMRRCAAIVQPSFFEGWSMLVEDARSLGKRIYVSDISIHKEQHPPNSVFFNPNDSITLSALLVNDWPQLRPGPIASEESKARSNTETRAVDFAKRFLDIAEKALKQSS